MEVFDNHSQKDIAIANVENGEPNATVNVEPNLVPYISGNKVGFANSLFPANTTLPLNLAKDWLR